MVSRRVTHQQNTLDEQAMGRLKQDFVQAFRDTAMLFNVDPKLVLNMDETPVYFDPEVKSTYACRGSKKVSCKKTTTTSKCSALLTVTASGQKLKPFVVFIAAALNGKVMKETDQYDKRNCYGVGPKGFCDTRIMIEWIYSVVKPYLLSCGAGQGSGTLLLT